MLDAEQIAIATSTRVVDAIELIRHWPNSRSSPMLIAASDGQRYIVRGLLGGRPFDVVRNLSALISEQIFARLGALLAAPTATPVFCRLSEAFVARFRQNCACVPGLAHGAAYVPGMIRLYVHQLVSHADRVRTHPQNSARAAKLAILYTWIGNDDTCQRQFHAEAGADPLLHALHHRHGFYGDFLGLTEPTSAPRIFERIATSTVAPDPLVLELFRPSASDLSEAIARLAAVREDTVAAIVSTIPDEWNFSVAQRSAALRFFLSMRDALIAGHDQ